jgi:hypothetical protein
MGAGIFEELLVGEIWLQEASLDASMVPLSLSVQVPIASSLA